MRRLAWSCLAAVCLTAAANEAEAHGGVFIAQDVCTLRIGFFEAQLKLYQPQARRHQEFCEGIPEAAETVFVMEYLHGPLSKAPIEFRIIRDVTGLGAYASRQDIAEAGGVEEATVFHQPATVEPDVLSLVHEFEEPGWYIGMVTVQHPTLDREYTTVFPFEVGFTGLGRWPMFAALAVVVQLHYWYMSGRLSRWRARWQASRLARVIAAGARARG